MINLNNSLNDKQQAHDTVNRLIRCIHETAKAEGHSVTISIDMSQTTIHDSFNERIKIDGNKNSISLGYRDSDKIDTISRQDLIDEIIRLQTECQRLREENQQVWQERNALQGKLIAVYENEIIRLTSHPPTGQ